MIHPYLVQRVLSYHLFLPSSIQTFLWFNSLHLWARARNMSLMTLTRWTFHAWNRHWVHPWIMIHS